MKSTKGSQDSLASSKSVGEVQTRTMENYTEDRRHASYVRFIEEHKKQFGPLGDLFTKFHLKNMEIIDFLEDDTQEGLTSFKFLLKFFYRVVKVSSMHGAYHVSQIRRHPCEV